MTKIAGTGSAKIERERRICLPSGDHDSPTTYSPYVASARRRDPVPSALAMNTKVK
jgi:hypothetical protein